MRTDGQISWSPILDRLLASDFRYASLVNDNIESWRFAMERDPIDFARILFQLSAEMVANADRRGIYLGEKFPSDYERTAEQFFHGAKECVRIVQKCMEQHPEAFKVITAPTHEEVVFPPKSAGAGTKAAKRLIKEMLKARKLPTLREVRRREEKRRAAEARQDAVFAEAGFHAPQHSANTYVDEWRMSHWDEPWFKHPDHAAIKRLSVLSVDNWQQWFRLSLPFFTLIWGDKFHDHPDFAAVKEKYGKKGRTRSIIKALVKQGFETLARYNTRAASVLLQKSVTRTTCMSDNLKRETDTDHGSA